MADVATAAVESSPTAVPVDEGSTVLAAMTHDQREHYFQTGEFPAPPQEAEAESAGTQEETAQSESPADAESAPSQEKGKRPGQKLSAEERIKELISERNELRRKLTDQESQTEASTQDTTEHSQAAAPADDPRPVRPVRPKLEQFDDAAAWDKANDAYETAMDAYTEDLTVWKARQLAAETAAKQAEVEAMAKARGLMEAYNANVAEAEVKYPDFREVVGNPKLVLPAVAQVAIVESGNAELAYVIAKDPKLQKRLLELNQKSTVAVVKELGKIEAALEAEAESATRRPDPPARTVTRAPKPSYEASGNSGGPRDPVAEAVDAGDYRSYERAIAAEDAERRRKRT